MSKNKMAPGRRLAACAAILLCACIPPDDWDWDKPEGYTGTGPSAWVHGVVFGLDDLPLDGVKICDRFQCVVTDENGEYDLEVAQNARTDLRLWISGYEANRYILSIGTSDFYVSHHLLTDDQFSGAMAVAGGDPDEDDQGLLSIVLKNYGGVPNTGAPAYLHATASAVPEATFALSPAPISGRLLPSLPYTEGTYSIYMAAIHGGSHTVTLDLPPGTTCGSVNGALNYTPVVGDSKATFTVKVKPQYINRVQLWCVD